MAGKTVIISGPAYSGDVRFGPFSLSTENVFPGIKLIGMAGIQPGDNLSDIEPRDGRLAIHASAQALILGKVPLTVGRQNYRAWLGSGRWIDFTMEVAEGT